MKLHVSELAASVGLHSEPSDWTVVDQEMITQFAVLTGDEQWIHVDPDKARAEGLDGTIAHGFLLLALIGGRFPDCFRIEGASRTINAGLDRVRFLAPVAAGASVRVRGEIADVAQRAGGLRARYSFIFEVKGTEAPVAVADLVLLHMPHEEK